MLSSSLRKEQMSLLETNATVIMHHLLGGSRFI